MKVSLILFMFLTMETLCIANASIVNTNLIIHPGQQNVVLECKLSSMEESIVGWNVNGTEYSTTNLSSGGLAGHSFVNETDIVIITPHNNTSYTCIVSSLSDFNRAQNPKIFLYIAGVPGTVINLRHNITLLERENISLLLTWDVPFNNFDPIINYSVSGCIQQSGSSILSTSILEQCPSFNILSVLDNTTKIFSMNGLQSSTRYVFRVAAANSLGIGQATSISVRTMGTSGPKIDSEGMEQNPMNLAMPVTFTCQATGQPIPTITWQFNDTKLTFPHPEYKINSTLLNSTTISGSLTVQQITSSEVTLYMCIASNQVGVVNSTGILTNNVCSGLLLSYGTTWSPTAVDGMARTRCARIHPSFWYGPIVTRRCLDGGVWDTPDLSRCSVRVNANPLIIISTYLDASDAHNEAENFTMMVTKLLGDQYASSINFKVFPGSEINPVVFTINKLSIEHPAHNLTEEIALFISNFEGFNEAPIKQIVEIIPTDTCICEQEEDEDSLNDNGNSISMITEMVCIGTALSPCKCGKSGCKCNRPAYVGNDTLCATDVDQDSFPDVDLQCTKSECTRGGSFDPHDPPLDPPLCPDIFSRLPDGKQDPEICQPSTDSNICQAERDKRFGIFWPNTEAGATANGLCLNGIGNATRLCTASKVWKMPDVTMCRTHKFITLMEEAMELQTDVVNEELRSELPGRANQLITDLMTVIVPDDGSSLLPLDLDSANTAIDIALDVADEIDGTLNEENFIQNVIAVYDVMLFPDHLEGWEQLQQVNQADSQRLLENTERFGRLVGNHIRQAGISEILVMNSNIAMAVTLVDTSSVDSNDLIFPSSKLQSEATSVTLSNTIEIPLTTLRAVAKLSGNSSIPVSLFSFNNIEEILPNNNDVNYTSLTTIPASSVLSATVGETNDGISLLEPVTLSFTFFTEYTNVTNVRCGFWNFSMNQGSGGWDSSGISVVNIIDNVITCTSIHLTSFAVLVDIAGAHMEVSNDEYDTLTVISFIGCGISILSLLVAITVFIYYRKTHFKGIYNFIHLNLCLGLLFALIVFVSGIETAAGNKVGCTVVAILLHYFFTAVFSWMLCEGIVLYFSLVRVFHNGFGKKRWFYSIIGWGTPIPIVSITAGVAHDKYTTAHYCWISTDEGAIWSFIAPMITIIIINVFFLSLTLYAVHQTKSHTERNSNASIARSLLKTTIILLPLLGFAWLFGLLAVSDDSIVFAWIFTILNSLQGLFILFFHVIRNEYIWNKLTKVFKKMRPSSNSLGTSSHVQTSGNRKGSQCEPLQLATPHCNGKISTSPITVNSCCINDNTLESDFQIIAANSSQQT